MRLRHPERFEELIRLKGLSQRKLAQQAHVSQAFISLMVSGQRGVRPVTAWRVASVLGVYASELFAPDLAESTPSARLSSRRIRRRPVEQSPRGPAQEWLLPLLQP
ncbi:MULTISPECIES: helix-turn-helix domain-containing protein [Streptomyces]|uniref:helix-turn-helix domain-containing protein n=1 Tax=Streptomyces TaxID=1883 RepID=UPI00345C14A5